jgi:hypothetical protein
VGRKWITWNKKCELNTGISSSCPQQRAVCVEIEGPLQHLEQHELAELELLQIKIFDMQLSALCARDAYSCHAPTFWVPCNLGPYCRVDSLQTDFFLHHLGTLVAQSVHGYLVEKLRRLQEQEGRNKRLR